MLAQSFGIIFQEKATILKPLGDIFLNLLLVVIVPLIFLTITTSITKMKTPKRLGKIIITIIAVFVITSLIAVLVGFVSTYFIKLVEPKDGEIIKASLEEDTEDALRDAMQRNTYFDWLVAVFEDHLYWGYYNIDSWFPLSFCGLFIYALWICGFGKGIIKEAAQCYITCGAFFAGLAFLFIPATSLMSFPIFHYQSFPY